MLIGVTGIENPDGTVSQPLFTNVWQAIAADTPIYGFEGIEKYANMNMVFIFGGIMVSIFIGHDYKSGCVKQLFTTHAKKSDYMISKSLTCAFAMACMCMTYLLGAILAGALMIFAFFIGAVLGGKFAGLPYTMVGFNVVNLLFCVLSKGCLVLLFVSIFLMMSVIAKQKLWLSILLSMGVGMFLFMVVPIVSPLDAGILHVILSLFGSGLFAFGFGCISNLILKKTALV